MSRKMIEAATKWAKADVAFGRVLITLGVILLVFVIYAMTGDSAMLKGAAYPIAVVILAYCGYGGFMQLQRMGIVEKVRKELQVNPGAIHQSELERLNRECLAYSRIYYVWGLFAIAGIVTYLINPSETWSGVGIGAVVLGLAGFLLDSQLHKAAKEYQSFLSSKSAA